MFLKADWAESDALELATSTFRCYGLSVMHRLAGSREFHGALIISTSKVNTPDDVVFRKDVGITGSCISIGQIDKVHVPDH